MKSFLHSLLTIALLIAQFGISAQSLFAQNADRRTFSVDGDLATRLAAIEKTVEEKRLSYGIPGVALAIVKSDKVIFSKGFGSRDLERKLPVTAETLFPIGSATKAFTAMATMISADEGKLFLDDSPKKFLPYFKLYDASADASVTLRDLMCHRTGLDRTDLSAQFPEKLSRQEVIKIAGLVKPTAKFREKFQYQNTMFTAAGEAAAKADNTTWENLVETRIFKPLGMTATDTSVSEMQKSKDFSLGYDYNPETKETRILKTVDETLAAPAGAINSSVLEMTKWLRLMLGGGVYEGKRLVSEKNFNELIAEQMHIAPKIGYGLGWFLRDWRGRKEVDHGGNIEGFSTMVAMIPEEKLGLVMLSNVSYSPLQEEIREIVFSNFLGALQTETQDGIPAGVASREVGKYLLRQANLVLEVSEKDGKLLMQAPGKPDVMLENVGGRRYKFAVPAPDGLFITFRPAIGNKNETELFLEQPDGNFILSKIKDSAAKILASPFVISPALREILGDYESERSGKSIYIAVQDSAVLFQLEGQPPLKLIEKDKDNFALVNLPEDFILSVKRDESGKMNGLAFNQQGIIANLHRQIPLNVNIEDLMKKVVEAAGGEANLRRHTSMRIEASVDLEGEGIMAETVISAKAPNLSATNQKFFALGKEVGENFEYFDGKNSANITMSGKSIVGTPFVKTGKILEDARIAADFYAPLDWKILYQKINVKKMSKIGDEDVYVVEKIPAAGYPVIDYISTKSFLVLRRESATPAGYSAMTAPYVENFSDFRLEDGVMLPHKIIAGIPHSGVSVTTVKTVNFNIVIPASAFLPLR